MPISATMMPSGTPNVSRARANVSAFSFQNCTPAEMRRSSTNSGRNSCQGLAVDGAAIARATLWLGRTLANRACSSRRSKPCVCTM